MGYLVDTHSHLNHEKLENTREILERAKVAGVEFVIVPGWDLPSSEKAIDLAEKFESIYAAVGFHPHDASKADQRALERIADLSSNKKVVAIGEIGLDYHYNLSPPKVQRRIFEAQIEIAKSVRLPVSIHNRESDSDLMEILERQSIAGWTLPNRFDYQLNPQPRGVLHSFNSTYLKGIHFDEMARQAIKLGFYLGISGMVTFDKKDSNSELRRIVSAIQPEHFLVETDAPYLAPVPHRGKRTSPHTLHSSRTD